MELSEGGGVGDESVSGIGFFNVDNFGQDLLDLNSHPSTSSGLRRNNATATESSARADENSRDNNNNNGNRNGYSSRHQAPSNRNTNRTSIPGPSHDWDDGLSWEDSEAFDGDSICSSPYSESESLCQNWRGWSANPATPPSTGPLATVVPHGKVTFSNSAVCSFIGGITASIPSRKDTMGITSVFSNQLMYEEAGPFVDSKNPNDGGDRVSSLIELTSRKVAADVPFEVVERYYPPVPENLQLRIAYWSFPDNEENIRLYSCLANGHAEEFNKGRALYQAKAVESVLQMGFHLSGLVVVAVPQGTSSTSRVLNHVSSHKISASQSGNNNSAQSSMAKRYNVNVTFDRCKITSCNCTCSQHIPWCAHVVALCLHRIYNPFSVNFRAPLSESLSRLNIEQFQKFSQFFINELPRHYLPLAQKILDSLLSSHTAPINSLRGAPDPTAGASLGDISSWFMEEQALHENIKKILHRFCQPTPTVCDVNYLSANAPPAASEWTTLLRPLRSREPEGLCNLLSIVQLMYSRHDSNSVALLHIVTQECLNCDQVVLWWFHTKLLHSLNTREFNDLVSTKTSSSSTHVSLVPSAQYSCATIFDGIVALWRSAILNPDLTKAERRSFYDELRLYHIRTIEKIHRLLTELLSSRRLSINASTANTNANSSNPIAFGQWKLNPDRIRFDLDSFPGFMSALEVCSIDFDDESRSSTGNPTVNNQNTGSRTNRRSSFTIATYRSCSCANGSASLSTSARHLGSAACSESCDTQSIHKSMERTSTKTSLDGSLQCIEFENAQVAEKIKSSSDIAEDVLSYLRPINDPIEIQFARCEGFSAHGFHDEACRLAIVLAHHLLNNPPDLLSTNVATSFSTPPICFVPSVPNLLDIDSTSNSGTGVAPTDAELSLPTTSERHTVRSNFTAVASRNANKGGRKKRKSIIHSQQQYAPIIGKTIDHSDDIQDCQLNPGIMQISHLASSIISKAQLLFGVLYRDKLHHNLAFRVGLWALQLLRQPAGSKFLEVKLYHQESEVIASLKRIELGDEELNIIRECAVKFCSGNFSTKPLAVLPLSLATYLFECLCGLGVTLSRRSLSTNSRDDQLGYDVAVAALALKSTIAEADHPLLCESIRRQKGELALALLLRYKDDLSKVALIMDHLLDSEMHRMYKHHLSNAMPFMSNHTPKNNPVVSNCTYICSAPLPLNPSAVTVRLPATSLTAEHGAQPGSFTDASSVPAVADRTNPTAIVSSLKQHQTPPNSSFTNSSSCKSQNNSLMSSRRNSTGPQSIDASAGNGDADASDISDVLEELMLSEENRDDEGVTDFTDIESLQRQFAAGVGTSTDHSNRLPSDCSSIASSSSGVSRDVRHSNALNNVINATSNVDISMEASTMQGTGAKSADTLNKPIFMKLPRLKKYVTPSVPNQPSEAHAHFMNELAKRLLTEAGGNHSTAIFSTNQGATQASQPHGGGPHRTLHLCAFHIGLYALGLHNRVTPNWLSRTYSSHVSWISGQAMEIGRAAIHILIASWENHLTPTEVANLADKGSQSRDPAMVSASAELALSALHQAHALSQPDIQRALAQCKEQNSQMLIKACLAVEQAAKDGGVYTDVLFKVCLQWYNMYVDSVGGEQQIRIIYDQQQTPPPPQSMAPPIVLPPGHHHGHHHHHHHVHTSKDRSYSAHPTPVSGFTSPDMSFVHQPQFLHHVPFFARPPPLHFQHLPPPQAGASPMDVGQQNRQPPNATALFSVPPPSLMNAASFVGRAPLAQSNAAATTTSAMVLPLAMAPYVSPPNNNVQPQNISAFHQQMVRPQMYSPQSPFAMAINSTNSNQQTSILPTPIIPPHIPMTHNFLALQNRPPLAIDSNVNVATPIINQTPNIQTASLQMQPMPPPPSQQIQIAQQTAALPSTQAVACRDPGNKCYLYAAYRVGMLALETLGRRIHDERSYVKYAQNPPYGDDVKFLWKISRMLGSPYVQQFCSVAQQAVVSPFILWDLAVEAAMYSAGRPLPFPATPIPSTNNASSFCAQAPPPSMMSTSPSSASQTVAPLNTQFLIKALTQPNAQPLMQRCIQMFYAAAHQKLSHPRFMQSDAEEVCILVRTAYLAFHHSNESFDNFMQSLRRQKACKKDLWNKLLNVLSG